MSDARQYAVWPDPRSQSRLRALQSWKSGLFISCLFRRWQWELATDHGFLNQGTTCKFIGPDFYTCPSFCVTWLWTWHKRRLQRVTRQSRTGLMLTFAVAFHIFIAGDNSHFKFGMWVEHSTSQPIFQSIQDISGTATDFIACPSLRMTNYSWKGRGRCHVTSLTFAK